MPRPHDDPYEAPATELDLREPCAICGRELWSGGLPPVQDGTRMICGDCDQAHIFEALDL